MICKSRALLETGSHVLMAGWSWLRALAYSFTSLAFFYHFFLYLFVMYYKEAKNLKKAKIKKIRKNSPQEKRSSLQ